VASTFGTGLGGMVHVVAGSLGVSAIVLTSAELFTALKLIGAAYLVCVGLRTLQSARQDASVDLKNGSAAASVGPRRAFRDGVLVEALNPKTAAFFLAFIPQFVNPITDHIALQFLMLGFVSVALNTLADLGIAFAASGIRVSVAGATGFALS
jgi:threonine/homoserine/homoserine lactone efflux protein